MVFWTLIGLPQQDQPTTVAGELARTYYRVWNAISDVCVDEPEYKWPNSNWYTQAELKNRGVKESDSSLAAPVEVDIKLAQPSYLIY